MFNFVLVIVVLGFLLLPGVISVIIRKNIGKNYRKGFSSIPGSLDDVIYLTFFRDKMIEEYEQDVLNVLKKEYDIDCLYHILDKEGIFDLKDKLKVLKYSVLRENKQFQYDEEYFVEPSEKVRKLRITLSKNKQKELINSELYRSLLSCRKGKKYERI